MTRLALEGLRVIELSMGWAVPWSMKTLAENGAQIIKIESAGRPDRLRSGPYPDNVPGDGYWNQSLNYGTFHLNKRGITLDLTKPAGVEVFKKLAAIVDVVAENYSPRVLKNFGLTYEVLRQLNPRIIMISSSAYGHSGPWQSYSGYGWGLDPMSGLSELTGYVGGPPAYSGIPYPDLASALLGNVVLLAALEHRRKTGEGQYIDLAQYEVGVSIIGDAVVDYASNDRKQIRMGNRHPFKAPHGCYRCKGKDKWVTIAVSNEKQWRGLCEAMGDPAWSIDSKFGTPLGRWHNQAELDTEIESWTAGLGHREAMKKLQEHGVPAGAVLNSKEVFLDPHVQARGYFERLTSPDLHVGTRLYPGPSFKLSRTPGSLRMLAPTLGRDNEYVICELLGMSKAELERLTKDGVIGTEPARALPKEQVPVIPIVEHVSKGFIAEHDRNYKQALGLNKAAGDQASEAGGLSQENEL